MEFDLSLALTCPQWLDVYANDVVLRRYLKFPNKTRGGKGNKRSITELSDRSLKRLGFFASNCTQEFHIMLTLTYPENHTNDGKLVKTHLNHFLVALRRKRKNIKYFWFLEFQENGSPHFHVFLSTKFVELDWVALQWNDIIAPGDIDHLRAGTRTEGLRKKRGAQNYAVKYSAKTRQKIVPAQYHNVGRFWGHSRGIEPHVIESIQVLGYDDVYHYLRDWKNVHIVNHDVIISVLWNVAKYVRRKDI